MLNTYEGAQTPHDKSSLHQSLPWADHPVTQCMPHQSGTHKPTAHQRSKHLFRCATQPALSLSINPHHLCPIICIICNVLAVCWLAFWWTRPPCRVPAEHASDLVKDMNPHILRPAATSSAASHAVRASGNTNHSCSRSSQCVRVQGAHGCKQHCLSCTTGMESVWWGMGCTGPACVCCSTRRRLQPV